MNFLLKIVEGPMKGAEIALVSGTRLKVGRGADCDIVLADASLDELAFELEVTEAGVTLIRGTGEIVTMRPFEVQDFGTTAVAIGPAEGSWEPLVRPQPAPAAEAAEEISAATPEAPTAAEPSVEVTETESHPDEGSRSRHHGCGWGCLMVVLLLLALLAGAAWWFLGRDGNWQENSRKLWERAQAKAGELAWAKNEAKDSSPEAVKSAQARAAADLLELASKHGLLLEEQDGVRRLKGNVKRRTERLALRSLALAADSNVKIDLTDDETLGNAVTETLQACADGAITLVAASNRVVSLKGFAPTPMAFEKVLRALNGDVKGIEKLDTSAVNVGGVAPAAVADTPFVMQSENSEIAVAPKNRPTAHRRPATARDYPISGILMVPFPCVIMRDGTKLVEGAQIGSATLQKIEADHLTLIDGGRKIDWRP